VASRQEIEQLVYRVLDGINVQLPPDEKLEKAPSTVLIGPGGKLDSLSIVDLVMRVQEEIIDAYGCAVPIAGEDASGTNSSPFRTVESLIDHVLQVVNSACPQ
jgi:acyl carrier protein